MIGTPPERPEQGNRTDADSADAEADVSADDFAAALKLIVTRLEDQDGDGDKSGERAPTTEQDAPPIPPRGTVNHAPRPKPEDSLWDSPPSSDLGKQPLDWSAEEPLDGPAPLRPEPQPVSEPPATDEAAAREPRDALLGGDDPLFAEKPSQNARSGGDTDALFGKPTTSAEPPPREEPEAKPTIGPAFSDFEVPPPRERAPEPTATESPPRAENTPVFDDGLSQTEPAAPPR
ncbi:MAG: hypothetical protein HKM95_12840, partial [Inquilinus sp.]|nr:hypothetical protein [Inquilinus sp.]